MHVCALFYQTVHTAILYPKDDDMDDDAIKGELERLKTFFTEMAVILEHTRDVLSAESAILDILERLNALLKDHLACRSHLQAASKTFKKEGQSARYFSDVNECGRLIGVLLTTYFTGLKHTKEHQ